MDIKIEKVTDGIEIESMVVKPVRGVTEEGITIFEDELQLKLRNSSEKSFSMIDCNVEYKDFKNKVIGFDSDGTLRDLKPNETCSVGVPLIIPEHTVKKTLTIESEHVKSKLSEYGTLMLLGIFVLIILGEKFGLLSV